MSGLGRQAVAQRNGLSQKQRNAIATAPPNQRARLTQVFRSQPKRRAPAANARRGPAMPVPRMLPAPAGRTRPQGRSAAGGMSLKQVLSIMDPLNPTPVPTIVSDGHAHINTGMDRVSFTLGVGERAMVFITNPGNSGMIGVMVKWSTGITSGGATISSGGPKWSSLVVPTLAGNALEGGGPTAGRAMKASVSILNSTPSVRLGGTVLTLNATQRIVWPKAGWSMADLTVDQANSVFTQVENQAQTRLQTGEFFKTAKGLRCHAANDVDYTGFRPFNHTLTGDDMDAGGTGNTTDENLALGDINRFLEVISTATPYSTTPEVTMGYPAHHELQRRSMSTICVLLESPTESQNYTITARGTYYTRWPMEHVLGQSHPPIPTCPPGRLTQIKDAAEHFKDMVHDAADGFAAVGHGIANAFSGATNAYSMYTQFQRARAGSALGNGALAMLEYAPLID